MKKFIPWLGAAFIITAIFAAQYIGQEQSLRLSANDPQIETAQTISGELNNGGKIPTTGAGEYNIANSLATITTVYNKAGSPLYSTGEVNGKAPTIAKSILTSSNGKSYETATLEPVTGVHDAAVVVDAKNYYTVSMRSLKEIDSRESTELHIAGYGWTIAIVTLILIYGMPFLGRSQSAGATAAYADPVSRSSRTNK